MLNMVKLDWLGMKFYQKRFIILPFMVLIYGFYSEAIIIPIMSYMTLTFSVNPFAVEEKGKLDNLYLTLPVTRKSIVKSRYGLSLIMQFLGLILAIIVTIVYSRMLYGEELIFMHNFRANFKNMSLIVCGSLLFYSVMNLFMFPFLFKIGYSKGKALGFYIPIGVLTVVLSASVVLWKYCEPFHLFIVKFAEWTLANSVLTAALALALAALVLWLSYALSVKAYEKREF